MGLPAEHLSVPADGMSSDIHGSAEYGLATTAETRIDARLSASPTTMDTRRRTHGSGCSHQRRHRRKPSPKSSTSSLRRHRRPRSSRSLSSRDSIRSVCAARILLIFLANSMPRPARLSPTRTIRADLRQYPARTLAAAGDPDGAPRCPPRTDRTFGPARRAGARCARLLPRARRGARSPHPPRGLGDAGAAAAVTGVAVPAPDQ